MKLLQKRPVAAIIMVLAILGGLALGRRNMPQGTPVLGEFSYMLHNEGGKIMDETIRYMEEMNASLFTQTGAQIVADVVKTTGETDIVEYAEGAFAHYGIGSAERDNGILLVLALENEYNGEPDGDYCIVWGEGYTPSQQDRLGDIMADHMEEGFIVQNYDAALRSTFDALIAYLEGLYHVTVRGGYLPPADTSYHAISGGYSSTAGMVSMGALMGEVIVLVVILLVIWVIADGLRYRRYRRRYLGPGMGIPPVPYYPIFWGRRPRAPRPPRPPRPPQPPRGPSPRPGGGTLGGSARRGSTAPRPGGGALGGSARRGSSGPSIGGSARRSTGGGIKRSSGGGGMHRSGGSRGGGSRRR